MFAFKFPYYESASLSCSFFFFTPFEKSSLLSIMFLKCLRSQQRLLSLSVWSSRAGRNTDVCINRRTVTTIGEHVLEHLDSHWRFSLRSSLYFLAIHRTSLKGNLKKLAEQNKQFMALLESVSVEVFYFSWFLLNIHAKLNRNLLFVLCAFSTSVGVQGCARGLHCFLFSVFKFLGLNVCMTSSALAQRRQDSIRGYIRRRKDVINHAKSLFATNRHEI